jgi:predicted carbohydrate-binding protein with CBM5 and CBM33 domain
VKAGPWGTARHRRPYLLTMTIARVSTALAVTLLVLAGTGGPAAAHGAPTTPLSRAAGCQPQGQWVRSAACAAAIATSGKVDWDNIRLAGVDGRDRQKIPDGRLCSAGLSAFRGLDLPRADWSTTALPSGGQITFTYRGTIPHAGTFRWYITKDGYSPTRPLRWADLDDKPFLTVANPPLKNGAYTMTGKLPAGRTGRHLIYTVWQTNPDTYYSCSDVVLTGGGAAGGGAAGTSATPAGDSAAAGTSATPSTGGGDAVADPADAQADARAAEPGLSPVADTSRMVPFLFGAAALFALTAAALLFVLRRRRMT